MLGRVFWVGCARAATGARRRPRYTTWSGGSSSNASAGARSPGRRNTPSATRFVREVAYEQIPRAQRGEKHRRVAAWLETLGRSEDLSELLAHHYLAMLDYSEPDPELAARAALALGEAGDRALALNAYTAAAGFYRRAVEYAGNEDRGRWLFGLGSALATLGDPDAAAHLADASEVLQLAEDPETAAEAECVLAQMAFDTGDAPGVRRHVGRAVDLVRGRDSSAAHAQTLSQAARFQMLGGELERRDRDWSGSRADGRGARARRCPSRCACDHRYGTG